MSSFSLDMSTFHILFRPSRGHSLTGEISQFSLIMRGPIGILKLTVQFMEYNSLFYVMASLSCFLIGGSDPFIDETDNRLQCSTAADVYKI